MVSILSAGVTLTATLIGLRLYQKYRVWGSYQDLLGSDNGRAEDIRGKNVIITGANTGIGKEVARELFRLGAHIIMACRNETECLAVIQEFSSSYPESGGVAVFEHLDLTSVESIKSFVDRVKSRVGPVHVLINNAAVYNAPIDVTRDGFEQNMQVNHLGPSLLTLELLPKLLVSDSTSQEHKSRIIMVTSTLSKGGSVFQDFLKKIPTGQSLNSLTDYDAYAKNPYAHTKLCNLLFARRLAHKVAEKGIDVAIASPGFALTKLHRNVPKSRLVLMALFAPLFLPIMRSSKDGAQTIIGCALASRTKSDVLYRNCRGDSKLDTNDTTSTELLYDATIESLKPHLRE